MMMNKLLASAAAMGTLLTAASAKAQEAAAAVEVAVETVAPAAAATLDSGDTSWMLISTALVLFMSIPGVALFYGGMARSKNMLSVLMQVFVVFSLICVLWVIYGYSLAFEEGNSFIGSFGKAFLSGITPDSLTSTYPEYVQVAFQCAFAAITCVLIVGGFAERIKFAAVLLFSALWFTFSYLPITHMVWGGGLLFQDGALDFAGGTVIHINAGIAALVGAYMVGKRLGFGKENLKPHSMTLTMVGACILWIGWFGFNAGSAAAANGIAGLAFVNTIVATAAATLSWALFESLLRGKPSMLGAASGAIAGLVVITPAAGFVGPMGALIMGLLGGVICLWAVTGLKRMLAVDDSFDVFGVHGVGGIIGAILTGVFAAPGLGGTQGADFVMSHQVWIQLKSVIITILWSGVVSIIAYKITDMIVGLRVPEDQEREGLDITSHGESAYHY